MSNLRRWADEHQYDAEPQPTATENEGVQPKVTLLHMNADPLGDMAMFTGIYSGKVHRDRSEITDDMRRKVLEDVQKTHLKAPLEVIKLHFLFEGVDRAFTHQHVRQRTAVYGQESMRFAVMGDLLYATTLPPSLAGTPRGGVDNGDSGLRAGDLMPSDQRGMNRQMWDATISHIDEAYHYLVENGVPAEEARGLLPHATATRIHYVTDLRNLPDHAGNRLCTQAQFHWRLVFAQVVDAIRNYVPDFSWIQGGRQQWTADEWEIRNRWQFEAIADSGLFRPVCYQIGYCPFEASFDRSCSIRERVEIRSKHGGGHDSQNWHEPFTYLEAVDEEDERLDMLEDNETIAKIKFSPGISPAEWLADPGAARKVAS